MPLEIPSPLKEMLDLTVNRVAVCWRLDRTDGISLFFTDHDRKLIIGTDTYLPAGSTNATARQKEIGLKENNLEISGILSSEVITNADLVAGAYRDCKVTEFGVDWRFPWSGIIYKNVFYIKSVKYTSNQWFAELSGVTAWLALNVGRIFTRHCPWTLGDFRCTINLAPLTVPGSVSSIIDTFSKFSASPFEVGSGVPDGWYTDGVLTWASGANINRSFDVRLHDILFGTCELHLRCPFAIQPGDSFQVQPGCDKLFGTCTNKFNNAINFGGFPFMPGTNAMIRTPR